MKIKIPKFIIKINYLRWLPWFLVILIVTTIINLVIFLNNNYLKTRKNINTISQLINEVAPLAVDIQTYNQILNNLEKRQQIITIEPTTTKNPFFDSIKEIR